MELKDVLKEIGLTTGEAKVYLALLKLDVSPVHRIKEETKLHRTNIYDFIEKLLEKGLVNYHVEKNMRHYSAVNPEKLLHYLQEKEETLKDFLPKFKEIQNQERRDIKVEVYHGREGIKFSLKDVLRVGKDYVAFGINEEYWEENFSLLLKQHFRKEKEVGIMGRVLTSENATMIYKHGNYKYMPNEFFSPTPIIIYGDRVCTIVWEPLTVIILTNQDVADSYRTYFEVLWDRAQDHPKKKMNVVS